MNDIRRDPVIHATPISGLRPTQMTVGFHEVERKRREWRRKDGDDKARELETHMIPVVLGPDGQRYVTDHHHLARALFEDGQKEVFVTVIGDLRKADADQFWNLMDYHGWTHPFDEKGQRRDYAHLPKSVADLRDDPYRSLAGALRRVGGFAKDSTPFSEFVWADFFRSRIKRKALVADFDAELSRALAMAKSRDADFLPGWCGSHEPTDEPTKKRKRG